ncbi:MAG: glycosyltransferase family 2 protein [Candidatus Omnitrophica bacterium]|nr:glycosyltransferase family 2 protein [Candidatus Omnitrophota bacterium]
MESKYKNCSVVIPAYNEGETIGDLLEKISKLRLFEEIIVVDDGSTDATAKVLKNFPDVIVIRNHVNSGNGASARKGILRATKDYVLLLDADGQHPPEAIVNLVDHAFEHDFDLVVGSRKNNNNISRFRSLGNWMFEQLAMYISGQKIDDLTCGFRIFKRSAVVKIIHLFPRGYSYPATSVLGLLALGYTVGYLRIPNIMVRQKGKSGIRPFSDFFKFLKCMLRIAIIFGPAKVFLPLAGFLLSIGTVDVFWTLFTHGNIQELGVIAIILSVLVAVFAIFGEQLARIRIEIGVAVANEMKNRDNE